MCRLQSISMACTLCVDFVLPNSKQTNWICFNQFCFHRLQIPFFNQHNEQITSSISSLSPRRVIKLIAFILLKRNFHSTLTLIQLHKAEHLRKQKHKKCPVFELFSSKSFCELKEFSLLSNAVSLYKNLHGIKCQFINPLTFQFM